MEPFCQHFAVLKERMSTFQLHPHLCPNLCTFNFLFPPNAFDDMIMAFFMFLIGGYVSVAGMRFSLMSLSPL